MDTNDTIELQEAVYLVDRAVLLHLKETPGGGFDYAVFDKGTKKKTADSRIMEADVSKGVDFTHSRLAAARDAAIKAAGFDGIEAAQVGLTSLDSFPGSDVCRRSVWEPETLPTDDIRFINSRYVEQFRIPNDGTIRVEFPDRCFSARCRYLDDYHACIGSEAYHMCQFAGLIERGGGLCRPEPELDAERAAWKIGWNTYLAVDCSAGHWDYKLLDEKFNEVKSGKLEWSGRSINEVRGMILTENRLRNYSMVPTDYGLLMEKAAQVAQEGMQKPSIKARLTAKPAAADSPPDKPKNKGAR